MSALVHIIPVLRDNYAYIVEGADGACVIVDPGQVEPVKAFIAQKEFHPVAIINTHHHADHIAGNAELAALYKIPVIGPEAERQKIVGISGGVKDGDVLNLAGMQFHVIETPGHTLGHVCFHEQAHKILLSGDTLFSLGCGRLIEGNADQMFASLQRLSALPDETLIFCGHEYTESNGRFALSVIPDNKDLLARMQEVRKRRANNLPTVPSTIKMERATNPFLRAGTAKEFAGLRARKDSFQE